MDLFAPAAQTGPPTVLEVDGNELVGDKVGDEANATDDESSYTSSVTSSISAYRQENGRTYHAYKEGRYLIVFVEAER